MFSQQEKAEFKSILSGYRQNVNESFEIREPRNSVRALRDYFVALRLATAYGCLSPQELQDGLEFWVRSKEKVFEITPRDALDISYHAFLACGISHIKKPCPAAIVNTVCNSVNIDIAHTVKEHRQAKSFCDLTTFENYLDCAESVLRTLGPHDDSPHLRTTFFESLTVWENLLFSELVAPATRFKRVEALKKNAQESKYPCPQLSRRCAEILKDAVYTKDGNPLLLNVMEEDADKIAEETMRSKLRLVPLFTGHAIRAGVSSKYAMLYHDIEKSFTERCYQVTEEKCFELFRELSNDDEDKDGNDPPIHISTLSYLMATATKLAEKNIHHGYHLAYRCISAIENENLFSETLQMTVYGFSLPIISKMERKDSGFSGIAKELYKTMMKRSSEFESIEARENIFGLAAIAYRQFLGSIQPIQRYDELIGLSFWLGQRKAASEFLQEFVDGLLNSSQKYGNFDGIPLEEDNLPKANFYTLQPKPR